MGGVRTSRGAGNRLVVLEVLRGKAGFVVVLRRMLMDRLYLLVVGSLLVRMVVVDIVDLRQLVKDHWV